MAGPLLLADTAKSTDVAGFVLVNTIFPGDVTEPPAGAAHTPNPSDVLIFRMGDVLAFIVTGIEMAVGLRLPAG